VVVSTYSSLSSSPPWTSVPGRQMPHDPDHLVLLLRDYEHLYLSKSGPTKSLTPLLLYQDLSLSRPREPRPSKEFHFLSINLSPSHSPEHLVSSSSLSTPLPFIIHSTSWSRGRKLLQGKARGGEQVLEIKAGEWNNCWKSTAREGQDCVNSKE
jgi:hypothetical protein